MKKPISTKGWVARGLMATGALLLGMGSVVPGVGLMFAAVLVLLDDLKPT